MRLKSLIAAFSPVSVIVISGAVDHCNSPFLPFGEKRPLIVVHRNCFCQIDVYHWVTDNIGRGEILEGVEEAIMEGILGDNNGAID